MFGVGPGGGRGVVRVMMMSRLGLGRGFYGVEGRRLRLIPLQPSFCLYFACNCNDMNAEHVCIV